MVGVECVHVNGRSCFDSWCVLGRVDIRGGEVYTYMSLVHPPSSANPCIATKVPSMLPLSDWHVLQLCVPYVWWFAPTQWP